MKTGNACRGAAHRGAGIARVEYRDDVPGLRVQGREHPVDFIVQDIDDVALPGVVGHQGFVPLVGFVPVQVPGLRTVACKIKDRHVIRIRPLDQGFVERALHVRLRGSLVEQQADIFLQKPVAVVTGQELVDAPRIGGRAGQRIDIRVCVFAGADDECESAWRVVAGDSRKIAHAGVRLARRARRIVAGRVAIPAGTQQGKHKERAGRETHASRHGIGAVNTWFCCLRLVIALLLRCRRSRSPGGGGSSGKHSSFRV